MCTSKQNRCHWLQSSTRWIASWREVKRNDLHLKSWIENSPASRVFSGDVNGNGKLQQNATRKTKESYATERCVRPQECIIWSTSTLHATTLYELMQKGSLYFVMIFMHIYATRSCFLYFLVDLIFFLPRWHRALRFGFSPKDGSVEEQLERPAVGHQIWLWPRYFRADMAEVLALAPETCFFWLDEVSYKLQTESLIAVKFTQCLHKKSLGGCPSHNKDATFAVKLCIYNYMYIYIERDRWIIATFPWLPSISWQKASKHLFSKSAGSSRKSSQHFLECCREVRRTSKVLKSHAPLDPETLSCSFWVQNLHIPSLYGLGVI